MLQKFLGVFLLSYSLIISSFAASTREIGFDIGVLKTLGGTPTSPGAGKNKVYVKDGDLKLLDAAGTEKSIGGSSATSSGVNILANASFEEPVNTAWTNSGGSFTQESFTYTTKGDLRYARFVATTSGQYFETVATTIPSDFSGGCQADFKKINVSGDDLFKVEVLDNSLNVLASANVKKSSWIKFPTIGFVCPTPGTQVKLRVTSLAAGTIEANLAYLGSNQNLVSVAQAKFFGGIKYSKTAGCYWSTTSTTYATFAAQAACPTPTVNGSASAPGTKIPGITFATMPAGQYFFNVKAKIGPNTAGSAANTLYRFSDGTTDYEEQSGGSSQLGGAASTIYNLNHLTQNISYATTQSNVTIQLKGLTSNAANAALIDSSLTDFTIDVYYFPSSSEVAVSNDQASWFIDANIGGSNPNLGSSAVSTYSEITDAGLDLVVNSTKGSASAEIACANGTASSGLTCSGVNESIGIAFTPKLIGRHKVCFSFSHNSGATYGTFQVIETSNTSTAIVSEGGQKTQSFANASGVIPQTVCGQFNINDLSKKTFRLMREHVSIAGTNAILADRSAGEGQRDIYVTVENLSFGQNRPILTSDQVTTPGAVNPKFFSVSYAGANAGTSTATNCTTGICNIDQIGNYVSKIEKSGAGSYNLVLNKTVSNLKCSANATNVGSAQVLVGDISCKSCSSIIFGMGVANDTEGTLLCHVIE